MDTKDNINSDGVGKVWSKKHPLGHAWTLWFDNPSNKQKLDNFGETLRKVYTFDTVEDFWCIHHNVALPGTLKPNSDIHLFKEGITPKWEDQRNEAGGRWTINIPKSGGERMINDNWLDVMLACIGEMFDDMDEICGVVCNVRQKGNRVCLWTSSSSKKNLQLNLGKQFKNFLGLNHNEKISYLAHSEAKRIGQSQWPASGIQDLYTV